MSKHITAFLILLLSYILLGILFAYGFLAVTSFVTVPIIFILSFFMNIGHPIIYFILILVIAFSWYMEKDVYKDEDFILPWTKYPVTWGNKLMDYPSNLRKKDQ